MQVRLTEEGLFGRTNANQLGLTEEDNSVSTGCQRPNGTYLSTPSIVASLSPLHAKEYALSPMRLLVMSQRRTPAMHAEDSMATWAPPLQDMLQLLRGNGEEP